MKQLFLSVLLLAILLAGGCAKSGPLFPSEPTVRVLIVHTLDTMTVHPSAMYVAADMETREVAVLESPAAYTIGVVDGAVQVRQDGNVLLTGGEISIASDDPAATMMIEKVPYGIGWWWANSEDRVYTGTFEARPRADGKLEVVLALPMETYLTGVVPQEIGTDSPAEALKAQAVAARSETVVALVTRKYAGEHYDLCSDVECQAFAGNGKRNAATDAAISDTRGLVLFHDSEPIGAYFASNCGGHGDNAENSWPDRTGAVPYWSGHPDGDDAGLPDLTTEEGMRAFIPSSPKVFCNPAHTEGLPPWSVKNFRWTVETSAEDLSARVAAKKDIGRVIAIRPGKRGISGRMMEATFVGEKGELTIGPELAIRQIWQPPLRSSCFIVDTEGPAERPEKFIMRGAGWGHGVGMCQTGAVARALAGQDFRTILAHYYRESKLEAAY